MKFAIGAMPSLVSLSPAEISMAQTRCPVQQQRLCDRRCRPSGALSPLLSRCLGSCTSPLSTELEGLAGQGTAAASAANFTWGLLPGHLLKHLGHWGRGPCSCFSLLAGCSFSDLWLFLLCSSAWKVSQGFLCVYQT